MNYTYIELIEGQKMKLVLTISNETDLSNYYIEGYTKGFSSCNCSVREFEVIEVKNNIATLLTPSLTAGSHGYQVYLTNINTNQQFKISEGRIEVTPNYGHETHLSEKFATIEATIYSDTIEMTMTIDKGMQGDKGDKGDKGEQGYSAYEVAVQHGYEGSEEQWVADFEGAQEAAATATSAAAEAKSSETLAEYYYKGSQTNYNNSITEASNAAQSASNAKSSATLSEQYSNNAKTSATSAKQQATLSEQYSLNAKTSATQSEQSARYAKSSEDAARNYSNESEEYYTQTIKSATTATSAATTATSAAEAAETAAATAQSLVTDANNTIKNAAIKTANNTFSGTNTFNGKVVANGGITLPAATAETAAVNIETSRLMDFVDTVTIREFGSKPVLKQGNGTISETTTLTTFNCQKDSTINILQQSAAPQYTASYIRFSSLWIPIYTNMNHLKEANNKFRIITQMATGFKSGSVASEATNSKFIYQWSDMNKPFTYFSNIEPRYQCGTIELFCETKDGYFDITVFSPIWENNKYSGVKMVKTKFVNGSWNYSGLNGILLVPTTNTKVKVFIRNFSGSQYEWIYAGEHYFIQSLYSGNNTTQIIRYAIQGTSKGVFQVHFPYPLKMQTAKPNEYSPNCQTILKAVTTSYHTEQTLTFEEYEAMQQPETTV